MASRYPPGSRFLPTDVGLVKLHLKNKVEKNISGFIKTLNVYGDAPWLLHHDTNHLYPRNEWYYFVPRTIRGVKTVSRMVPSNGESFLGGTWKSIGKRKDIKNKAKELLGYKRELVFNKIVPEELEKKGKTDWHMDEYSLHKDGDEFHDLVLCHVRLLNSDERFRPIVPAAHDQVDENNDNNNDVVLPNQEQHQQQQEQEQEDSLVPLHPPLQSNDNQREYLLEAIVHQYRQQQEQEDSLIPPHPPLESNRNLEPCPFDIMAAYHAENDMTGGGYGLMQNFNQGNDDDVIPPLQQSNDDKLEKCPFDDIDLDGVDDNDMFDDADELLEPLPPLQSNDNHGQCRPSWDIPSQVENNDNNNNNVPPNQEQREAGFADHNDMTMMVEKEHGDVKQHQQQQQDLEQLQKDLLSFPLDPWWDDDFGFGGAEDDWIMQNMDEGMKLRLQELQEELSKLLQPVPQPQDSGVHVDQVMPKESFVKI